MLFISTVLFAFTATVFGAPTAQTESLVERATPTLISTQFPNYLNIIKQQTPDAQVCTGYTGQVGYSGEGNTDEVRLLVGFDVPSSAGENCLIKFQLPPKEPFGYQWTVTGSGKIDVWSLQSPFTNCQVSWNNKPEKVPGPAFQITQPLAGGVAAVSGAAIPCKKGQRQDFELTITRPSPAFFDWFELNSPVAGITLQTWRN